MEILNSSLNTPLRSKLSTPSKPSFFDSISKVRVVVRVRQFLSQEIAAKSGIPMSCVSVLDQVKGSSDEVTVYLKDHESSRNECYKLDSFFGQEDNNVSQIFESEVNPLIPGIFQGCNATIFAYGATGSGKTYTMQGTNELPGLMPLAMSKILSICQSRGSNAEISYYEVYMDRCYDLLELKTKEIAVLDDKDGHIHLRGLSRVPINSISEFHDVFSSGVQRRKVAHTGLNDVSSRSHGVLVISISTPSDDGTGAIFNGKLNLIDLAGNEDNRRTCNEGVRLQESAKINQSLFALSNVIYALNNNQPRVPYRESKLTRILQDSLGGTSRALIVACLNPGEYQESVHTVSLAARSRHISNFIPSAHKGQTPKVKVDMEAKLCAWLESKGKTKSLQRMKACAAPFLEKDSALASTIKKPGMSYSVAKAKAARNQGTCDTNERTFSRAVRSLHNPDAVGISFLENLHRAAEDRKEESLKTETDQIISESNSNMADEVSYKESHRKSPSSSRRSALQNPSRRVLSPINANIDSRVDGERLFIDRQCSDLLASPNPATPFSSCANKESQGGGIETPLNKFNAYSSNLKSRLIQEYINFLNTANRHELQEIKGIGLKTAEYILELRETSPLKSLSDLEKIGLSSKQVHNLFSTAMRGVFTKVEDAATSSCLERS